MSADMERTGSSIFLQPPMVQHFSASVDHFEQAGLDLQGYVLFSDRTWLAKAVDERALASSEYDAMVATENAR